MQPARARSGPRRARAVDLDAGDFEPRCPECDGALLAPSRSTKTRRSIRATCTRRRSCSRSILCRAYAREHDGVTVTALRYHNVYGPRMPRDTPYAGVASIFRSALASGLSPRVFEDGAQTRDFVHVRDVAHANVCALTHDPYDGALNVASGDPHTVLDMAIALHAAFGPDVPAPQVVGGYRLGDVRHVFASPARAEQHIGFRAAIEFADGMKEFAHAPQRAAVVV